MGYVGRQRAREDEGFTLVELLVIVVIIGILAGIAITTYMNQARKADRSAAISTLSNMRLAAESIRADDGGEGFSDVPADYEAEQGSYDYVGGLEPSTGANVVSVGGPGGSGDWVSFAVRGRDECYYLRIEEAVDTLFQHTAPVVADDDCSGSEFGPDDTGTGSWG